MAHGQDKGADPTSSDVVASIATATDSKDRARLIREAEETLLFHLEDKAGNHEGAEALDEIATYLQSKELRPLLTELGLGVVGFAYFDHEAKHADLTFFGMAKLNSGGSQKYQTGYQWDTGQVDERARRVMNCGDLDSPVAAAKVIDTVFWALRSIQTGYPSEADLGKSGRSKPFLGEYLAHLPPARIEEGSQENQALVASERSDPARKRYGALYVPIGEVRYFTFAWRYLFGCMAGQETSFENEKSSWDAECALWTSIRAGQETYVKREQQAHLESAMFESDELKNAGVELNLWCRDLEKLRGWSQFLPDACAWRREWARLGLINAENDRVLEEPLSELIRFARKVAEGLPDDDKVHRLFGDATSDAQIAKACGEDADALDALEKIDTAIKKLICTAYLPGHVGPVPAENEPALLRSLHAVARFPIIPYFYWNALRRESVTHLVLPIWSNAGQSFEYWAWHEQSTCESLHTVKHLVKSGRTRVEGAALVGVVPCRDWDWTIPSTETEGVREGTSDSRGDRLVRAVQSMARPQVSMYWYVQYLAKQSESAARRETMQRIIGTIGHDVKRPASLIESALERGQSDASKSRFVKDEVQQSITIAMALARSLKEEMTAYARLFTSGLGEMSDNAIRRQLSEDRDAPNVERMSVHQMLREAVAFRVLNLCLRGRNRQLDRNFIGLGEAGPRSEFVDAWEKDSREESSKWQGCLAVLAGQDPPRLLVLEQEVTLTLPSNDPAAADTGSRAAGFAMRVLIREVVTNFFNHALPRVALFCNRKGMQSEIRLGIDVQSVGLPNNDPHVVIWFAPWPDELEERHGTAVRTQLDQGELRSMGLTTLAEIASAIGAYPITTLGQAHQNANGAFLSLPWYQVRNQRQEWIFSVPAEAGALM